jgi:hypothetical protein
VARTHAYVLWKGEFGEARWRGEGDEDGEEMVVDGAEDYGDEMALDGGNRGGDDGDGDGEARHSTRKSVPHYFPKPKLDPARERPSCTPEVRKAAILKWFRISRSLHADVEALKVKYPH